MPCCLSASAAKQNRLLAVGLALLLRRVLRRPIDRSFMRPFAVAGVLSKCLRMRSGVRKGMLSRKPRLAALMSVCVGGQKNAWCIYFTLFCKCGIVCTLFATNGASVMGVVFSVVISCAAGGGCGGLVGRLHSCVSGSRGPCRTHLLLASKTAQRWRLNPTAYPASQNFLVEMSDECVSPGKMCACVTSGGSQGMSRL